MDLENIFTRHLLEKCTEEEREKIKELVKKQKEQKNMFELGVKQELGTKKSSTELKHSSILYSTKPQNK